jgi:hypothetical protein
LATPWLLKRKLCAERHFRQGLLLFRGRSIGRDVILYKDVDMVGNADICRNVILTSRSSAGNGF